MSIRGAPTIASARKRVASNAVGLVQPEEKKLKVALVKNLEQACALQLACNWAFGSKAGSNWKQSIDPSIASGVHHATPTSRLITSHAFADFERNSVAGKLKQTPFSLFVRTYPERDDVKSAGLAVVVRYIDERPIQKKTPRVVDELFALVNARGKTVEKVAGEIEKIFEKRGVPWENCVAVASDDRELLETLKTRHGDVLFVNFLCRSMESCFLRALKVFRDKWDVEKLCTRCSKYRVESGFVLYSGRKYKYTKAHESFEKFEYELTKSVPVDLRRSPVWLLHLEGLKLLLGKWDKLEKFFVDEENNLPSSHSNRLKAEEILGCMYESSKAVVGFLVFQLEKMAKMDELFRSDQLVVFGVLEEMRSFLVSEVLKGFLREDSTFFTKPDGVLKTFQELDLDWLYEQPRTDKGGYRMVPEKIEACLLPVEKVNMGQLAEEAFLAVAEAEKEAARKKEKNPYLDWSRHTVSVNTVPALRKAARQYYVDMAFEIAKRFDVRADSTLAAVELLNPCAKLERGPKNAQRLAKLSRSLLKVGSDVQKVTKSWDDYCRQKNGLLECFSAEEREDKQFPVKFWKKVRDHESKFPVLGRIGLAAMVFPHTTKHIDALFQKVNRVTSASTTPVLLSLVEDRLLAKQFSRKCASRQGITLPGDLMERLARGDYREKFARLCEPETRIVSVDDAESMQELEQEAFQGDWFNMQ